jgi:transposase
VDCSTRNQSTEIEVKNLDHLGLVAGIIDEIGIVEIINEQVSIERGEIVTAGQVVKAIILNGLGFVSRALYLFPQFFEDKATEHLLGEGIEPKQLNDDKIGGSSLLGMVRYGGINRLNPYLARDLID